MTTKVEKVYENDAIVMYTTNEQYRFVYNLLEATQDGASF